MCGLKSGSSLLILNCTRLIKHITIRVIRGLRPQRETSPHKVDAYHNVEVGKNGKNTQ